MAASCWYEHEPLSSVMASACGWVAACTKSGSRRWGIAGGLYGREELAAQQVVFGDAPVAAAVKAALDFRVILAAKLARDGRDGLDRSLERSGQITAPSRGGGVTVAVCGARGRLLRRRGRRGAIERAVPQRDVIALLRRAGEDLRFRDASGDGQDVRRLVVAQLDTRADLVRIGNAIPRAAGHDLVQQH